MLRDDRLPIAFLEQKSPRVIYFVASVILLIRWYLLTVYWKYMRICFEAIGVLE